ncbi:YgiT-type zinc finger protein, partial [Hydrogenibacillus schlegelii]
MLKRRSVHYPPHLIRGVPVWTCPACGEVRLDARTKAALRPLLGRLQGEAAVRVVTFPFSSRGRPAGGRKGARCSGAGRTGSPADGPLPAHAPLSR